MDDKSAREFMRLQDKNLVRLGNSKGMNILNLIVFGLTGGSIAFYYQFTHNESK